MDPKKINREKNFQVRLLAAKLMEARQNVDEVANVLGCRRDFVKQWYQRFQQGGPSALQPHNAVGRPSKLNTAQKAVIKEILFNRGPLEFGFSHALWTNRLVLDLIEMLYKVKLRMTSVNNLLESFGVMHAPFPTAVSPKKLLARIKSDLRVDRAKLMLFFRYPIEIASDEFGGKLSAPSKIGRDRRMPPKRVWLAGAIDGRHSRRFMIAYREPVDDQFVVFLEKLIHHAAEPINLLIEESGLLDAPVVNAFLGTCNDKLRLIQNDNRQPQRDHRNKPGES